LTIFIISFIIFEHYSEQKGKNMRRKIFVFQTTLSLIFAISSVVFFVIVKADDSIAQAIPINIGYANAITGVSITPMGDVDYYKFTAEANRTYVIETFNIPKASDFAYPLGIQVVNSDGNELGEDVDGREGTGNVDARVIFQPDSAGTYFVRVASTQNWTGVYSLRILPKFDEPGAAWDIANDAEPNDVRELAYHLAIGADNAQVHALSNDSSYETNFIDQDMYRFNAEAGQRYVIETFNVPPSSTYSIFRSGIVLINTDNNELATYEEGEDTLPSVDARIEYTIMEAGTYFIKVTSPRGWTGQYSVRVCQNSCVYKVYLPVTKK
jgi:hypothetical protein